LKIEARRDFARGKVTPQIRLKGLWLADAGFKTGTNVKVSILKEGLMTLEQYDLETSPNLSGAIVTLKTRRANGIPRMVEVVSDDSKWITWVGAFGGRKRHRSKRCRVLKVLSLLSSSP